MNRRAMADVIQPKGWPRPRGYANGMLAAGRLLAIGGQVGSKPPGMTLVRGLLPQFAQAMDNVIAVVKAAGGKPSDVVSLTIFVTDLGQYQAATRAIREAWSQRFGNHYPAMALVEVKSLIDHDALVEIQGFAVL
jgi:enamine deaminase RidA (YjgF/YER057c/UK114 family)